MPYKCSARRKEVKRTRRIRHLTKLRELKENTPCADCGKNYPHYVMEIDHIVPRMGSRVISTYLGRSWEFFLKEMEKCEIVCGNCHNTRTFLRRHALVV